MARVVSSEGPEHEAGIARVLQNAGRRDRPSHDQLQRWRVHLVTELTKARRRRRGIRGLALIGAGAAAVLAVFLLRPVAGPAPAAPVAEVVTVFGGVIVREEDSVDALVGGDTVRVGDRVEVGRRSGAGLVLGDVDLRLDSDSVAVVREAGIDLRRGRLYVDAGRAGAQSLRVRTPLGEFEHVGTQYQVSVRPGEVIGAVREGRIVLHRGGADDMQLRAGADSARLVVLTSEGVSARSAAAAGELWDWVEPLSAGLSLPGLSADEVLRWVARERGLRLIYATPRVRDAAQAAVLGGSAARPVYPEHALTSVEATTRLRVTPGTNGALTIQLDSEADQDPD